MLRRSTEVRNATPDEMSQAVAAIVAAFITDPVARFAWSSPYDYLRACPLADRRGCIRTARLPNGCCAKRPSPSISLAYLESTNPRNISLYLRHGFEVIREIRIGAAPPVTPMIRRPR